MHPDRQFAARAAECTLAIFGLAGELAALDAKGPGSLRVGLVDYLHCMTEAQVLQGARLE